MITLQLTNPNPYVLLSGMAAKIKGQSLPAVIDPSVNSFCYCEFECEYVEKVFGAIGDNDFWKNDKRTFPYRKLISTDTVTIKLFKADVLVATIIDNTYGIYTNGYPAPATPEQKLYVVFTIDFQKVLTLQGPGQYQIKTDLNILGNITTEESVLFQLYPYSDLNANGTVRIETNQNGNIIGSTFDFTDLNLYQSYRIRGKLTETTPELESDRFFNNDYELKQIQDKVINKWLLKTEKLARSISVLLSNDSVLANEFLITDYNIINEAVFRRIPLYPESMEKPDIGKTTRPIWEVTFTDKIEDKIKRNN